MLRRGDERGFVLVTSMMVLAVMLMLGVAVLSIVDTQTEASGRQRDGDASFNLAESAADSAAFVLGRNWPTQSSPQAWSTSPCSGESLTGGVATTAATGFAAEVQNLVAQTSAARGGPANATWKLNVCAVPSATAPYSDAAVLGQPGWDNGNGRLWVRAQATVNGRRSAVAAMVGVSSVPAQVPANYVLLAGRFTFSTGATQTARDNLNAVLGNASTKAPLLNMLLSQNRKVVEDNGAPIGIRCGLVTQPCAEALEAGVTDVPLLANTLGTQKVYQVPTPATAASAATIRGLRSYAATKGWYVASVADGQPCIPASMTAPADRTTWMVYVDRVGTGDGTCTLAADGTQHAGVIVGSGRIRVSGTGQFNGVVYGLNQQATSGTAREIVSVTQNATVKGDILVDGNGSVGLYPPTLDVSATINSSPICNIPVTGASLCAALRAIGNPATLVTELLKNETATDLMQSLQPQLATYGPAVSYDAAIAGRLSVLGGAGVMTGSFRQIPPN